jgi:hypothetical protein
VSNAPVLENVMKSTRHDECKVIESLGRAIGSRLSTAMRTAAAVLLVASGAGWSAASNAQPIAATELPLAQLERSFWVCDHAATVGLLDSGTAIACGSLAEVVKQRKFGGDFNAMLAWWRQHKEAEHRALAKAGGPSLAGLAPTAPE